MTIQMPCERKRYEYPNAWWKERVWLSGCQVEGNSMTIQMLSEKKQGTVWLSKCLVKCLWLSVCQMKDMAIRKPGGRKHYGYRDARWKETVWLSVCHVKGNRKAIRMLGWKHWATYCSKANKTAAKVEKQGDRQTDRRLKIILCRLIVWNCMYIYVMHGRGWKHPRMGKQIHCMPKILVEEKNNYGGTYFTLLSTKQFDRYFGLHLFRLCTIAEHIFLLPSIGF